MMNYSSFIQTPLSDFAFIIAPHYYQSNPDSLCAHFERKFMDCVEAYGARKAYQKCADITFDMHECRVQTFQILRAKKIHEERMKQYRAGKLERPFEENPPLDSYLYCT